MRAASRSRTSQPSGSQPAGGGPADQPPPLVGGVGRIGQDQLEIRPGPGALQPGNRIRVVDDAAPPRAQFPHVLAEQARGRAIGLDEDDFASASTEGLEPQGARPRIGVEHPGPGDPLTENVEQRLAHPLAGGPHLASPGGRRAAGP